ncbi:phosphoribosyl-dephospho-CoA transferase [Secundilactobacillus oryzae JCM 18671]|uniref:citrate lyase holo-[acyl-carrier protein] synthase n=1 Tax=Secundilactobacillus oryzae JCM 18671 TaxID=1291743 RepID=A0A081BHQ2_9LACO|nr:citrate lyase holo-[acyl-carrier protein] synthase [Secundilactobacillus oryzae]GAK47570.1 phosphoribosyl-dephospho-CoA transferase [Secundilactobacillus oryzae JCM 18671]
MESIFREGNPQGISDVLKNKDDRVSYQQQLLEENPKHTIIAAKLNIPGPIKNNQWINQLFETGMARFLSFMKEQTYEPVILKQANKDSGSEAFILLREPALTVKALAAEFEDTDRLGRLFDLDVLTSSHKGPMSRTELNLPVRRCFICNRPARECARSRRHTVADLQAKITQVYDKEFGNGEMA